MPADSSQAAASLFRVHAVAELADGSVAVANEDGQLTIFGAEGMLASAARPVGDGPDEFRDLAEIFEYRSDSLIAFDAGRARASVLDNRGQVVRSLPLIDALPGGRAVGVLSDQWLVTLAHPTASFRAGLHTDSADLIRYDLNRGLPDTLMRLPVRERFVVVNARGRVMGGLPFGAELAAAIQGDAIHLAFGTSFEVLTLDSAGHPASVYGHLSAPRQVDASDRDAYMRWRVSRYRGPEAFSQRARGILQSPDTPYPELMPVIERILPDPRGWTWVLHYAPPWEQSPRRWSVFDGRGRWLAVVTTPPGLEVRQIGLDHVLGITRSALGAEHVAEHPLLTLDQAREQEGRGANPPPSAPSRARNG